jgi:murein DD-endopeptidase MepM/ murein hydrolase activator NlpD
MTLCYRLLFLYSLVSTLGVLYIHSYSGLAQVVGTSCSTSATNRFWRHQIAPGETLKSIAQRYNVQPETIILMNPAVENGKLLVGSEIQIPPYNGFVVEVPPSQNWRQVAAKYKVRPDVLFELNGCQQNPRVVFVPSVDKKSQGTAALTEASRGKLPQPEKLPNSSNSPVATSSNLAGYPLKERSKVAVPYGWQTHPQTSEVFFHSGVDLLAGQGTAVHAISDGTVVFAKEQGTYGNLVIINHNGGLQSRYAHLDNIKVSVGQKVNKGDLVGAVGITGTPTLTEPHLHFEIRSSSSLGWVAQDPKEYLQP